MGQAADRKVTEIEEARRRLEADLQELEDRLPVPLRSVKSIVGVLFGTGLLALLAARLTRGRRSDRGPSAEVVVRIVDERVTS